MTNCTIVALAAALAVAATARGQQAGLTRLSAGATAELRQLDRQIDTMLREGDLRIQRTTPDLTVAGRTHERAAQFYKGVPVFGADVTRQLADGQTVSIFGTIYSGISLDVVPRLTADDAAAVLQRLTGQALGPSRAPQLVILPLDNGDYALTWHARLASASGIKWYFIDAADGTLRDTLDDLHSQSAVGRGRGVLGDEKKLSVESNGSQFLTLDTLRPPRVSSFDLRGNLARFFAIVNGNSSVVMSDYATDADNDWTDGALVDAHAYSGLTYDYFFKRFGRNGLDDKNVEILNFVHPVRRQDIFSAPDDVVGTFYVNAFFCCDNVMVYGEGIPAGYTFGGQTVDFQSGALDVVAHELTHGVTDNSSRLIYRNESGALNESFSDVMAVSVEFYYQQAGSGLRQADYLIAEDTWRPGGIRSLADPRLYDQPDHYSKRFTGTQDNGGVHINSGISNNAFYLAIEGGVNRTSGQAVAGVGSANREQIEKIFYRAFTAMMPANANFGTARAATVQAARDLYGAGSAAERAISQAWSAVGVR